MNYVPFDLYIERSGEKYRARVNSPCGEADCEFASPITDQELRIFRLETTRARPDLRRAEPDEMRGAREFGQKLFDSVFVGDVQDCLIRSLEKTRQDGVGLRVRMRLSKAPELVNLPWEYLYESSTGQFLALSKDTPVVRYVDLPVEARSLAVKPPVRMLVVISSPKDLAKLDIDREWKKLQDGLARLTATGLVVLNRLEKPSFASLLKAVDRTEYHILHFVGHGQFDKDHREGMLMFEDQEGNSEPITAQALGVLVHDASSLRLAVLNSCEGALADSTDMLSGTAQTLIQQGIPAVIAMQSEISEGSAQVFSETFYEALATGAPVDAALASARKVLFGALSAEWGAPVLYMRSPDGQLFEAGRLTVELNLSDADQAIARKDWKSATEKLNKVLAINSSDKRAQDKLAFVEEQMRLASALPRSSKTVPVTPPQPSPAPARPSKPAPLPTPTPDEPKGFLARVVASPRFWPTVLLAVVFVVNWLETFAETFIPGWHAWGSERSRIAGYAFHELEGNLSFEHQDLADAIAIYGYSLAYFFLLPILAIAVAVGLARYKRAWPYRCFAIAVGIDYAISLPFFLFFPVPERWAYPDSGAILLSDRWTTKLIEAIRPISGLDNCFPSSHVSLTVILIMFCYRYRFRLRAVVLFLGLTIILSTFILGIHWIPDIVAGLALGFLSSVLAMLIERRKENLATVAQSVKLKLERWSSGVRSLTDLGPPPGKT